MNCTVCGKLHSPEAPLTLAYDKELLCPDCLEELDRYNRTIDTDSYYGTPPLVGYGGTIKIGTMELPIKSFELKLENNP